MLFPSGTLCIRKYDQSVNLFFPSSNVFEGYSNFNQENVAELRRHGLSEPSFGGYVECAQPGEHAPYGIIEIRSATDEDINEILQKWDQRRGYSISEWLANLTYSLEKGLLVSELERLTRLCQPFLAVNS